MNNTTVKNIRVSIMITHQQELNLSINGERLNDYEFVFSDQYLDSIKNKITHNRWGLWFKQIDELTPTFMADIYTDNFQDYSIIASEILNNPPRDIQLQAMDPYWTYQRFVEASAWFLFILSCVAIRSSFRDTIHLLF